MTVGVRTLARPCRVAFLAAAIFISADVRAQTGTDAPQVFDRSYFERYDVVTAEDMVRRVPGTAALLDALAVAQEERGFGSGGDQVLLNGKRFAGKGQVLSTLRRIQSAKVERVELIRGNSGDTGVQSEGLIVNVVLIEGAGTGSGSWQAAVRFNDRSKLNGDGLASYSDSWGLLDYTVGVERAVWSQRNGQPEPLQARAPETYFYPNGSVNEARVRHIDRTWQAYIVTTNLAYNLENGDRFRLNGRLEPQDTKIKTDTAFTRFGTNGVPTLTAIDVQREHSDWETEWEVGGDYEGTLGRNTKFNLLLINTYDNVPNTKFRNLDLGTSFTELSRNINVATTMESIVRGSLTWPLSSSQSLEVGGEGVRNILRQSIRPFFDLNNDGRVEEISIPTSNARVQEMRGEAFANHKWKIARNVSLNSSLVVEISRITNNFPFSPGHTYIYPKPRVDLRYDFTSADQLRLKVERKVGQLDFANFVPTFDVQDSEIDAGNPDLRPEREWDFELGYQRQLPGKQGLLEGRVFYRAIQDHIDLFLLRTDSNGLGVSAKGNIGDARHYGAEAKASIRLGFIGIPDLAIDGRYLRQHDQATDPFTGLKRRIVGTHWDSELDLGLHHDVVAWGFSYGLKYQQRGGVIRASDIRVQKFDSRNAHLEAFAEKTLGYGLTLRAAGYGLMPPHSRHYTSRVLYVGSVATGVVSRRETYTEHRDRLFMVSLRGTF